MDRRRLLTSAGALAALATGSQAAPAPAPKPAGRFRCGLNSGTLRGFKLNLAQQVELAAKAGYDGLEPWLSDVTAHARTGSLKDLGKRCADLGLAIYGGIGFASWIVDDEAQRGRGLAQLEKEMGLLAELGGTHIACPPAGATKPNQRLEPAKMAERYRAALELGRKTGVVPELEIWGFSANVGTLAEALQIAALAAHPDACVLPDVFHLFKGGTDPAAVKLLSRSAVKAFHLNDYPQTAERATAGDAMRIWPGDGVAPLTDMLGSLAANGCDVMLSLELFNADYWKLPAEEAARIGLAKMKAVVARV